MTTFNFVERAESTNLEGVDPSDYLLIELRKNASQKSIKESQTELERRIKFAKSIDCAAYSKAYLFIGGAVRWGTTGSTEAWGYNKNMVDSAIAGQEY